MTAFNMGHPPSKKDKENRIRELARERWLWRQKVGVHPENEEMRLLWEKQDWNIAQMQVEAEEVVTAYENRPK